ncbi:hypothetical protein [Rathayibacter sp. AY1H3]|nr:hypothetical protein [Rathayibacter sp. AY1H3]
MLDLACTSAPTPVHKRKSVDESFGRNVFRERATSPEATAVNRVR